MVLENKISPIIETKVTINDDEISRIKINYSKDPIITNNHLLPKSIQTIQKNITRINVDYDRYDPKGNILQYSGIDEIPIVYLWSYNGQYPIAEIKNASYDEVKGALSWEDIYVDAVSSKTVPLETDMDQIDMLRDKLPKALVTTYTYKPLVGMLTSTDPRGVTTYYDYDSFGRLKEIYIKDKDGKKQVVEAYDYNYRTQ